MALDNITSFIDDSQDAGRLRTRVNGHGINKLATGLQRTLADSNGLWTRGLQNCGESSVEVPTSSLSSVDVRQVGR